MLGRSTTKWRHWWTEIKVHTQVCVCVCVCVCEYSTYSCASENFLSLITCKEKLEKNIHDNSLIFAIMGNRNDNELS